MKNNTKIAESLAATINSLCRAEESFDREHLLSFLEQIYSKPKRLTMPLRKLGILKVSKGIYTFQRQSTPIFYKTMERILENIDRGNSYRNIPKKKPSMMSVHSYCFYINSTDPDINLKTLY